MKTFKEFQEEKVWKDHHEVDYIDHSGNKRFTVVATHGDEDPKSLFRKRHKGKGVYKRITNVRGTGRGSYYPK